MEIIDKVLENIKSINYISRAKLISYPEESDFSKKEKVKKMINKALGRNQKAEGFSWHNAFLAQSLEISHKHNNNKEDLNSLINYYNRWYEKGIPIDNLDNVMNGTPLIYVYQQTKNDKYKEMIDVLVDFIITHEKDRLNSLPYRPNSSYSIFIDSLGMISPFLAYYGKITKDAKMIDLSVAQLNNFIEYGFDSNQNLPYHAYTLSYEEKKGIIGWGRAVGWLMIGIIDTLEHLESNHLEYEKLNAKFNELTITVLKYQKKNGAFSWQLQALEGMNDSSATAMIGYSIIKAVKLGVVDSRYLLNVEEMINYLLNVTEEGYVMESSAECLGLGMYPQRQGWYPWSQGPTGSLLSIYMSMMDK